MKVDSQEATRRAMEGARLAKETGISNGEAAKQCSTKRSSVSAGLVILRYATEQEIADLDGGSAAFSTVYKAITLRVSEYDRRRIRKTPAYSEDTVKNRRGEAAIWQQLNSALDALCGLPRPSDVVLIVRKHARRHAQSNKKIIAAFDWLTEFSDAWTK